jgi:hypothetical protein
MGFFERFRPQQKEKPKVEQEKRELVPSFEQREELERLIEEYESASTKMFGITHDSGIDMNTDLNDPKIQDNPNLKSDAEEYFQAQAKMREIEENYGQTLREYLQPYAALENVSYSHEMSWTEWNRWRVAKALEK